MTKLYVLQCFNGQSELGVFSTVELAKAAFATHCEQFECKPGDWIPHTHRGATEPWQWTMFDVWASADAKFPSVEGTSIVPKVVDASFGC